MEIPPALEDRVQRVLDLLNQKLLRADPRLAQIAATLSGATQVAARDRDGSVNLRLVPEARSGPSESLGYVPVPGIRRTSARRIIRR